MLDRSKGDQRMWWAIGIAAVGVVLLLIAKLRSASRQTELATIVRNHLAVSFRMMNVYEREIDQRVWSDPYLLGYAQGSTVMLLALFGKKLSTVQKGMVSVNALKDLVGDDYGEVCERMISMHQVRDPEFVRGEAHGSDVMALIFNKAGPELLADPEVQAALRQAPVNRAATAQVFGDSAQSTGPLADAGGVLMSTYMQRHKDRAGY